MEKLLVISDLKSPIRDQVKSLVEPKALFEVVQKTAGEIVYSKFLEETSIRAVVFDCEVLDRNELAVLIKIRQMNELAPILILADQISIYSYRKVDIFKNMIAVQKPLDDFMCFTLLKKMKSEPDFTATPCPRFITDQAVRVLHLKTGLIIPTQMRNYSASGAFLEYKGISVRQGDELQIQISQINHYEKLRVTAKVVWTRDGDHARSPIRGLGVQFTNWSSQ